jgi:hypothetical protein
MEKLEIKPPSARVISKMRNGHKVRVCKGSGFDILLSPNTYSQISKSFGKGKGANLQMTAEEIMANKEMEGGALFKDIKRGFKKLGRELSKAAKPVIEKVAPVAEKVSAEAAPILKKVGKKLLEEAKDKGIPIAKQLAKEVVKKGVQLAPSALASLAVATGNPQLAPVAMALGRPLSKEAGKQLNKKIDSIDKKKAPKPAPKAPIRKPALPRPVRPVAPSPVMEEPDYEEPVVSMEGQGLYAGAQRGRGLYAGRGLFGSGIAYSGRGMSSVSGSLMRQNPALQSQPQFVNQIMEKQMGMKSTI